MVITESRLRKIIKEAVLTEIEQQTKAKAFVDAKNDMERLSRLRNKGVRITDKNGKLVDVDNEIGRRDRQMRTFGDGLAHDISMQYDPNREDFQRHIRIARNDIKRLEDKVREIQNKIDNGYNNTSYIYSLNRAKEDLADERNNLKKLLSNTNGYRVGHYNGGYHIETPRGDTYAHEYKNGFNYPDRHNNFSNVNRLHDISGISDAMMGYDDERNGYFDAQIEDDKRKQANVQAIRDYDADYASWKENDDKIRQSQWDYDRMSSFNPKKWFSKRPADGPQPPQKPDWKNNRKGQFDGYFSHANPEDYNADIEKAQNLQSHYRNAKQNYFKTK